MNNTLTTLNYTDSNGYIRISLPEAAPSSINSVLVIDVDGNPTASDEFIKIKSISLKGERGASTISALGGTLQIISTIKPFNATDNTLT